MLRPLCLFALLATPVMAQQDKTELCTVSARIAGQAVAERSGGGAPEAAVLVISEGLDPENANFAAAVQPIVEWVWTLPEEQLTDEVATAYEAACLAQ